MLIPVTQLSCYWNIKPNGVLHVGAHKGEESGEYTRHNWGKVVWVEAQPELVTYLRTLLKPENNQVLEAAVWDESGTELDFNLASNGESSSLLDFGSHATSYPHIIFESSIKVRTKRLDEIIPKDRFADFLNMDVQGVELKALQGLGSRIIEFKWVYTEVNKNEVYKNCTRIEEIDEYLSKFGFSRTVTRWVFGKGWGDALYTQTGIANPSSLNHRVILVNLKWISKQFSLYIKGKVRYILTSIQNR